MWDLWIFKPKILAILSMNLFSKLNIDFEQINVYLEQLKDQVVSWATQGVNIIWSVVSATRKLLSLFLLPWSRFSIGCRDEEKVKKLSVMPYRSSSVIGQW